MYITKYNNYWGARPQWKMHPLGGAANPQSFSFSVSTHHLFFCWKQNQHRKCDESFPFKTDFVTSFLNWFGRKLLWTLQCVCDQLLSESRLILEAHFVQMDLSATFTLPRAALITCRVSSGQCRTAEIRTFRSWGSHIMFRIELTDSGCFVTLQQVSY